MANGPFVDPETGLKRQREQRPEGEGTRWVMRPFGPRDLPGRAWEIYHCLFEGCPFDTQWSEAFDIHYFQKHIQPFAEQRALEEAVERAKARAGRMKQRPESPILNRS